MQNTITDRTRTALEYLRSITNRPRLEIQQVQLLMILYDLDPEGVTMQDLGKASGYSQSMISRNASVFGVKSNPGAKRVLGLRIGEDVRYRIVHFLPAGKEIMNTFLGIIEGTVHAPNFSPAVDKRTKTKKTG